MKNHVISPTITRPDEFVIAAQVAAAAATNRLLHIESTREYQVLPSIKIWTFNKHQTPTHHFEQVPTICPKPHIFCVLFHERSVDWIDNTVTQYNPLNNDSEMDYSIYLRQTPPFRSPSPFPHHTTEILQFVKCTMICLKIIVEIPHSPKECPITTGTSVIRLNR